LVPIGAHRYSPGVERSGFIKAIFVAGSGSLFHQLVKRFNFLLGSTCKDVAGKRAEK